MPKSKNPHAVAMGRKGGIRSTPAKAAAARRNGRRGGRPKNCPIVDDNGNIVKHESLISADEAKKILDPKN